MDPIDIARWLEDDDEILASHQLTIALLLNKMKAGKKHGGSRFGWKEIHRNRLQGHMQLYNDYFSENPTYPENIFRRRFRMRRSLFLKIINAISQEDKYFIQKRDAAGQLGFSPLQKGTAAIRILAYGYSADSIDEYLRISQSLLYPSLRSRYKESKF
jgi:hypothetical protein